MCLVPETFHQFQRLKGHVAKPNNPQVYHLLSLHLKLPSHLCIYIKYLLESRKTHHHCQLCKEVDQELNIEGAPLLNHRMWMNVCSFWLAFSVHA